MTKLMEIYKCNVCGNIVEVLSAGAGELVCCGEAMAHLAENTNDTAAKEKHVPVLTIKGLEKTIRVGEVTHPMENSHYIMFIEAISEDKVYLKRKYLKPLEDPSLVFDCKSDQMLVRELCNLHGLWSKNYD